MGSLTGLYDCRLNSGHQYLLIKQSVSHTSVQVSLLDSLIRDITGLLRDKIKWPLCYRDEHNLSCIEIQAVKMTTGNSTKKIINHISK